MTDQDPESDDPEAPPTGDNDGDEYEVVQLVTRQAGAATLRRLADGVARGRVRLGENEATVALPEQFELEIEYEEDEEAAELEVELEWPIVDGEAVVAERESEPTEPDDAQPAATGKDDGGADQANRDEDLAEKDDSAEGEEPIDEAVGVGETASKAQFDLYRDRSGEWRWRLVHDNGNIIADSGEGYDRKATARTGLESVIRNAPGAPVVVHEE